MLPNAAKCQGYSFYRLWVIKGKPTDGGRGKIMPPLAPSIRVKLLLGYISNILMSPIFTFAGGIEMEHWLGKG